MRPPGVRGDLASADALERDAVSWLVAAGARVGHELAGVGPVALGEVGIGNTTIASALTAALLAAPVEGGYEIDIHLQGPGETVFFAI